MAARAELRRRGSGRPEADQHQGELERGTPALDPAEVAQWREAYRQKVAEIRSENRTLRGLEPEAERTSPLMDPEIWAELKSAQTARVEADRQARREDAARAVPVTEEEIAWYDAAAERQAQADVDAAAALDRIQVSADAVHAGVSRRAAAEARRTAEIEEAGINEPVAQAEASVEAWPVWEPGTAASAGPPEMADRADAEAGLEI